MNAQALMLSLRVSLAVAAATGLSTSIIRDTHQNPALQKRVRDVAAQVNLEDILDVPVKQVSYGNRRQLEVGLALVNQPKVLLMDEPTSGVGPGMIHAFHGLIKSLPKELTILIIEHDMELAFDVADRITVLNCGKVVFEGTPDETRQSRLVNEIYLGGESFDA